MRDLVSRIADIGVDPNDSEDQRLQKALLVLGSLPFALAGAGWGVAYILLGELKAGLIPLSYSIFSVLSIIHFGITRKYRFFRFSQLLLILVLPFLLMVALGGFINGSGVLIWSVICPLGALLFHRREIALRWLYVFLALVIVSGFIQPHVVHANHLSREVITIFFVMNMLCVALLVFLLVYYFVGQKNLFQEKSENLLLNILPKEIALILRNKPRTIADQFESASILFADVVGFTTLSTKMSANELVELLNDVFTHFDLLVEKYGLEKIKTIGDCYMVASGVPRHRDDHAQALAALAIEMRDYANNHAFRGHELQFRIGMNCGPVVAGVIGTKKFIYDLWGDAVNMASRMESQGRAGGIQITEAMFHAIKNEFDCREDGTIRIKGRGETRVWALNGVR